MIAGLVARVRSLWRGVRQTQNVDAEMQEEMRLHMEMRAADLVRSGLAPDEAARRARLEFGGAEYYGEKARHARGLRWFDQMRFSWLDLKLGGRMLVKYPVLTIVGGVAMAFAIWVGAGAFEILRQFVYPDIPLPQANRIVVLQNWDAANSRVELRSIRDFLFWRDAMKSVDDVGGYRSLSRNLIVTEGTAEAVLLAEMSAAAFRVVRVPPLMGRTLADADEAPDAPLVAVIGFDLWQRRFQSDPNVVGRTVRIGGTPATVVGVMPKGFAFPRTHQIWTPLKADPASVERLRNTAIRVVGRLAPGATMQQGLAELTQLGRMAATDFPETHRHLRPQLMTFSESLSLTAGDRGGIMMVWGNLFIMMLLTLVCANVALLMFARAATREAEIAVRSALGASRGRIVMQLFAEALVLGGVAAAVGLTAASWGLRWALWMIRGEIVDAAGNYPFWVTGDLSPMAVGYTVLLTIVAAGIAGVVPGLKITRGLNERLKSVGSRATFGGLWTAVIVLQIAVTMGVPVVSYALRQDRRWEPSTLPFQVDRYVAVRLGMERTAPGDTSAAAFQARFLAAVATLEGKLTADPGVEAMAFAELLPLQYHVNHGIDVDEGAVAPADERGHVVGSTAVEPRFFDVLGVSMLSGRSFNGGDASSGARVAIVNKAFVNRVLGGKSPVGRRIRYRWGGSRQASDTLWYEIVGMAPDLGTNSGWGPAGVYHVLHRASQYPVQAAVRVRGNPAEFAPRLRAIATDVDVTLQVSGLMPLRNLADDELSFGEMWIRLTTILSVMVLVLSLVAIYAVMSFAVSRRTREIGVRVALGATRWSVLRSVFAQPIRQIAFGIVGGAVLIALMVGDLLKDRLALVSGIVALVAVGMAVAATVACIVPTRRALAVQPMDALRTD